MKKEIFYLSYTDFEKNIQNEIIKKFTYSCNALLFSESFAINILERINGKIDFSKYDIFHKNKPSFTEIKYGFYIIVKLNKWKIMQRINNSNLLYTKYEDKLVAQLTIHHKWKNIENKQNLPTYILQYDNFYLKMITLCELKKNKQSISCTIVKNYKGTMFKKNKKDIKDKKDKLYNVNNTDKNNNCNSPQNNNFKPEDIKSKIYKFYKGNVDLINKKNTDTEKKIYDNDISSDVNFNFFEHLPEKRVFDKDENNLINDISPETNFKFFDKDEINLINDISPETNFKFYDKDEINLINDVSPETNFKFFDKDENNLINLINDISPETNFNFFDKDEINLINEISPETNFKFFDKDENNLINDISPKTNFNFFDKDEINLINDLSPENNFKFFEKEQINLINDISLETNFKFFEGLPEKKFFDKDETNLINDMSPETNFKFFEGLPEKKFFDKDEINLINDISIIFDEEKVNQDLKNYLFNKNQLFSNSEIKIKNIYNTSHIFYLLSVIFYILSNVNINKSSKKKLQIKKTKCSNIKRLNLKKCCLKDILSRIKNNNH